MNFKDIFSNWVNVLLIIVAILILFGVYSIISNPGDDSSEYVTPEDILENPNAFIGKSLIVEGYYYHETFEGRGVISSSIRETGQSSIGTFQSLTVDHSMVNITLVDRVKYRFIGQLTTEESVPGSSIIFIAEAIDVV